MNLEETIKNLPCLYGADFNTRFDLCPLIDTCFGSSSGSKTRGFYGINEAIEYNPHVHKLVPIHHNKLTQDEHDALKLYAGPSKEINLPLWNLNKHNTNLTEWQRLVIGHIDSALYKHKSVGACDLYTGLHEGLHKHLKNGFIHLPKFTSTTTTNNLGIISKFAKPDSSKIPKKFGNFVHQPYHHVLKIHAPTGTHALSMMDHSQYPMEHEVLLHRGYELRVENPTQHGNTIMWNSRINFHNPCRIGIEFKY